MAEEQERIVYQCPNKAGCDLGHRGAAGLFSGGITAEAKSKLTGEPVEEIEANEECGEGWCPNCGTKGTAVDKFTPYVGEDELASVHEEAHASVAEEIARINDNPDLSEEEKIAGVAELSAQAQQMVEAAAGKEIT